MTYPVDGPRGITQAFGSRPEVYAQYGFPGHEGVDLRATLDAPVRAVADGHIGVVSDSGNYGKRVSVIHEGGYQTTYAHLNRFADIHAADPVKAGDVIGYAGSTGNSTGVHLHLGLKRIGHTYTAPNGVVWPFNIHDPSPYLAPFLSPPAAGLSLLPYLRGDGRSYRVINANGGNEIFQSQTEGDTFYQVKAWEDLSVVHWEQLGIKTDFIVRDIDTSPGGGRYYRTFGAPWVKRIMAIGESFTQAKKLQFYRLSDCAQSAPNSGNVTDTITLVAHYPSYTFRTGYRLSDVIELKWEQGGERYFYAASYGLVAWERAHQDPNSPAWSAIAEMRPGTPKLERLKINCL